MGAVVLACTCSSVSVKNARFREILSPDLAISMSPALSGVLVGASGFCGVRGSAIGDDPENSVGPAVSSKSDTARPVARAARASRRALCGEGGASVCAPDSEGGASMVGDSVKNACCDNFPCALMPLFPPLLRYFRCGRVYIYATALCGCTSLRQWIQCRARA